MHQLKSLPLQGICGETQMYQLLSILEELLLRGAKSVALKEFLGG